MNLEGKYFYNSNGDLCNEINVIRCNAVSEEQPYPGHIADSRCYAYFNESLSNNNLYLSTATTCIIGAGGGFTAPTGSGVGGTSSNNTGGLGASGGNNNPPPPITLPISCRTGNCIEASIEQETLTPCEELLNLFKNNVVTDADTPQEHITENPDLEDEINHIKEKVYVHKKEFGYLLDFKNTIGEDNNEIRDYNATYTQSNVGREISWLLNQYGYTYGIIHTHPEGTGNSIPSFGDLNTLVDIYEQAKRYNKSKVVMIVIAKDPNNNGKAFYAVKIDDFETLKQFIKSQLLCDNADGTAQEPCSGKKLSDRIGDIHKAESEYYGSEIFLHEKKFLEKFSSAGISLYRANDALTNWRKLKIVGTTVDDSENCNN